VWNFVVVVWAAASKNSKYLSSGLAVVFVGLFGPFSGAVDA